MIDSTNYLATTRAYHQLLLDQGISVSRKKGKRLIMKRTNIIDNYKTNLRGYEARAMVIGLNNNGIDINAQFIKCQREDDDGWYGDFVNLDRGVGFGFKLRYTAPGAKGFLGRELREVLTVKIRPDRRFGNRGLGYDGLKTKKLSIEELTGLLGNRYYGWRTSHNLAAEYVLECMEYRLTRQALKSKQTVKKSFRFSRRVNSRDTQSPHTLVGSMMPEKQETESRSRNE